MGKKVGIWLDHEKAYVISLFDKTHMIEKVESNIETRIRYEGETKPASGKGNALVNPSKKRTKRKRQQMNNYIECLISKVNSAEAVFIFGPAEAKRELNKLLIKRYDKPSVYVEPADKMTEKQMVARVRKHFNGTT
ncbi:MAG TPA: hypothetical protein VMW76_05210 [Bacteroidales bacterium]|nr:hypothetical protein [Bacteroidales bacterium]